MASESLKAVVRPIEGCPKTPEGLAKPYVDICGYPTIGFGHRIVSVKTAPISMEQAEALLDHDLDVAAAGALAECPGVSGKRLDALTDFVFNLGQRSLHISHLREKVNAQDWPGAAAEVKKWNHGHVLKTEIVDGKPVTTSVVVEIESLTRRRAIESAWLLEG